MSHEAIQYLPIAQLAMQDQVRKRVSKELVQEVMRTMELVGQMQPIRVRRIGEELVIVAGHLRFLAARELNWQTIAAIIEERPLTDGDIALRQLIENLARVELSPMDSAKGLANIMEETGCRPMELSKLTGLHPSRISKLLSLLELDEPTREKIATGAIAADTGYQLSRIKDPVKRAELSQRAQNGELTRDDACAAIIREQGQADHGAMKRVKAVVDEGTVTVSAPGLAMESFISLLEHLLGKARKAKAKQMLLDAFVRSLKSANI